MEAINWTKEQEDFIRNEYIKSNLTRKELLNKFNQKFNKRSMNAISKYLSRNKITKSEEAKMELLKRKIQESKEERYNSQKEFRKQLADFIKEKQKQGLTQRKILEESQKEFEAPITFNFFKQTCIEYKIEFKYIPFEDSGITIELLNNKKLIEFLKDKNNHGQAMWELENNIIDKFKFRLNSAQIRRFCTIKGIKIGWE
jgi:hypothetical protein